MQIVQIIYNRPYALTSRLHNNDAMLGVKTCRAARTCFAGRAHWRSPSQSVCAPGPARRWGMQGLPSECMLGDGARGVPRLTPNTTGAPFCDVICIWSIYSTILILLFFILKNMVTFCRICMINDRCTKPKKCISVPQLESWTCPSL